DSSWLKAEQDRQHFEECVTRRRRGKLSEQEFQLCVYGTDTWAYDPKTGKQTNLGTGEVRYPKTHATDASSSANGLEVYYKVTEQNDVYWRFAWRLPLRNSNSASVHFSAVIKFQDAEGFDVAEDHAYDLSLEPGEEREFTGAKLIDARPAPTVTKARVE